MSKNDITGDNLKSRPNSKAFDENFDKIFGKQKIEYKCTCAGCSGRCGSADGNCVYCCGRACSDEQHQQIERMKKLNVRCDRCGMSMDLILDKTDATCTSFLVVPCQCHVEDD